MIFIQHCKYDLPPPSARPGVAMCVWTHVKGSMLLTFPKHRLCLLDWVQAHVLFLCMLVASAHLLGMHGPEKHTQTHF